MLALLQQYTLQQIILFVVMLALAIKGAVDFFDWCKQKYQKKFDKDYAKKNEHDELVQHYKQCASQHDETLNLYNNLENKIDTLTDTVNIRFNEVEESIKTLTDSDMHDIKGWIVEKHHKYIPQNWVDDFAMDTLEKRYSDYKKEGGNSYINGLMDELRALPHVPPQGKD